MKRLKFLIAIFIGTFMYAAVSFFAGKNGIWCYSQLLEQKKEIARQADAIESINNDLNLEYVALLKDRDRIAAFARKLDYVSSDEKLVKINGLKPYQVTLYNTGSVLRSKPCSYIPETYCKIIGLLFFLLSGTIMFLVDLNSGKISFGKTKNKDIIQGIPVYDVPQV